MSAIHLVEGDTVETFWHVLEDWSVGGRVGCGAGMKTYKQHNNVKKPCTVLAEHNFFIYTIQCHQHRQAHSQNKRNTHTNQ